MTKLAGKHALITGGGQRIGAAIARSLAEEDVNLTIHYGQSRENALKTVTQLRARGVRAEPLQADILNGEETTHLIKRSSDRMGAPLNILINNASLFQRGPLLETSRTTWEHHLAVNLTAPFLLMQAFARELRGAQGHIINIIDQRVTHPCCDFAAYTTSKSALWTITQIAALEFAPAIRVNAIAPGPILPAPGMTDEAFSKIGSQTPLQRTGSPENIVDTVIFILKNNYITGEIICVDGGKHL